jgi:hypothetical protein
MFECERLRGDLGLMGMRRWVGMGDMGGELGLFKLRLFILSLMNCCWFV